MNIVILGAGAFGTALAISLAQVGPVGLWTRDPRHAEEMKTSRQNPIRLPGPLLPESVSVSAEIADFHEAGIVLLAVPMQEMEGLLATHGAVLDGRSIIACAKGMNLATGEGPTALIRRACPLAISAILTGPSFASDIARGLPTALTLATGDEVAGEWLQSALATPTIRLYRTDDTIGAEAGGALKNVIAIAAGMVVGAGLGDSARAALVTRGFSEMVRLAVALGARAETLSGLSGLGDLILTCTSPQSRNFRFGRALSESVAFDPSTTVEGKATAIAASRLGRQLGVDLPVTNMVAALVDGRIGIAEAAEALLARPLKKE